MIGIVILAAASTVAAAPTPRCPGDNTIEINECRAAERDRADAELKRYLEAARQRLTSEAADNPDVREALADLDKSQAAWAAYRTAECDAIYDYWKAGTIRTVMALSCEIDLTRQRTHQVWSQWLTYMDSTPPILPEPSTQPAP